jgi:DNA repair exonuclease SbcCD ATPase subunit
MGTEPDDASELSVTLPPSLSEWLDDHASSLGIEREALLVQLLETHRSSTEVGDDGLVSLFESDSLEEPAIGPPFAEVDNIEDRLEALEFRLDSLESLESRVEELEAQLDSIGDLESRIEATDGRVDTLEAKLENNVEDVRDRVLQLRDAVEERAPSDHSHEEFRAIDDRLDSVSETLETLEADTDDVGEEVSALAAEIDSTDDRIDTAEDRLDRLARIVVAQKRREEAEASDSARLDAIRRTANRNGTDEAVCGGCGESVQLGLLSEPVCPHCDSRFSDIEASDSILQWFKKPHLTVEESIDEADVPIPEDTDGEGTDE